MSPAICSDHHAHCTAAPAHHLSPGLPAPESVLVCASILRKIHKPNFQIHPLRLPSRGINGREFRPGSEVVHTIQKELYYPADPAYLYRRSSRFSSEKKRHHPPFLLPE